MASHELDAVVRALGLEDQERAWSAWWLPIDGDPAYSAPSCLTSAQLSELVRWLQLDLSAVDALHAGLTTVHSCPEAKLLLSQCTRMMALAVAPPPSLPRLPERHGVMADVFGALVVLGCVSATRRRHQDCGIREAVTRATFNDVARWMRAFREAHGRWGFAQTDWMFNHVSGRLVELGRLQYGRGPCDFPYHVYCEDGDPCRAALLVADGYRVRPDGQFLDADRGIERDGPHVTTRFDLRQTSVTGHRVTADGRIELEPTTLPLPRWRRVLQPGGVMLDVHIPAYAPLSDSACADSFRQALEFFPRHFPEQRFAGFTCASWLMDPQLALYLPAESNIVRFQRRFMLAPATAGNDFQHFERVFGGPVTDVAAAPRDTVLRRALLEHVERGRRWRFGYGIALRPDVDS